MSISWEISREESYKLQNSGKWQSQEVTNLKKTSERLFWEGGTLKIGDSSIKIPRNCLVMEGLHETKKVLDSLKGSQASTGPTAQALKQALNKDLQQQISITEENIKGAVLEFAKTNEPKYEDLLQNHLIPRADKLQELQKQLNSSDQKTASVSTKPLPGEHPHLGNEFSKEIKEALHPESTQQSAVDIKTHNEEALKKCEFADKEGNIDFTKLGLSAREVRQAHLKGKIWVDEHGEFKMKITGNCGDQTVKALEKLKEKVNDAFEPKGPNSPISINPEAAGKLTNDEREVLNRGGQIQFKSLQNGQMLKLTLDPGEEGKDDGLTLSVLGGQQTPKKIPLSVVFEGKEFPTNGLPGVLKDGHPILEDWRKQDFFAKSVVHQEIMRPIPFTSYFDRVNKSNADDAGRMQAENTLWNAVYQYLDAVLEDKGNEKQVEANNGGVNPPGGGGKVGSEGPATVQSIDGSQVQQAQSATKSAKAFPKQKLIDGVAASLHELYKNPLFRAQAQKHNQDLFQKIETALKENPVAEESDDFLKLAEEVANVLPEMFHTADQAPAKQVLKASMRTPNLKAFPHKKDFIDAAKKFSEARDTLRQYNAQASAESKSTMPH